MNLALAAITDPRVLLPAGGKKRFTVLADAVSDDKAIGAGYSAQILDKMDDKDRAQKRKAHIRMLHEGTAGGSEAIAEQDRLIAEIDATLARLNERAEKHLAVSAPRATLLRNIEAWIRDAAPGHEFVDIELVEPPKLLKGETAATAIEKIRRRLRELDADARRIEASPYPAATAKAVAANYINELADAAAPIVSSTIEHAGPLVIGGKVFEPPIVFASKQANFDVTTIAGQGVAIGPAPDAIGLMAWLFKDQMLARINEAIDAEYDPSTRDAALTHEQRREQLATIAADRAHAEQDEAHLLWASYDAGVIVEPRADMSPSAFLMVQAIRAGKRQTYDHADIVANARRAREAAESGPAVPGSPS